MTGDLTRAEQRHLADIAGFHMLQMTLPNPSWGRPHAVSSCATGPGYSYHAKGINRWVDGQWQTITWARIEEHCGRARGRDPELADDILSYERARVKNQVDDCPGYPPRWHGIPWILRVNELGMTYDEVDRHREEIYYPACTRLSQRRRALLERVFPLLTDDEPVDLLELLDTLT